MILASWGGRQLEVSAQTIEGISKLGYYITAETEDKDSDDAGYKKFKTATRTLDMDVILRADLNVDVRSEVDAWMNLCAKGHTDKFYVSGQAVCSCAFMLTAVKADEIEIMPDGTWKTAEMRLEFAQTSGGSNSSSSKKSSSSSSSSGGSKKASVKKSTSSSSSSSNSSSSSSTWVSKKISGLADEYMNSKKTSSASTSSSSTKTWQSVIAKNAALTTQKVASAAAKAVYTAASTKSAKTSSAKNKLVAGTLKNSYRPGITYSAR